MRQDISERGIVVINAGENLEYRCCVLSHGGYCLNDIIKYAHGFWKFHFLPYTDSTVDLLVDDQCD